MQIFNNGLTYGLKASTNVLNENYLSAETDIDSLSETEKTDLLYRIQSFIKTTIGADDNEILEALSRNASQRFLFSEGKGVDLTEATVNNDNEKN